MVRNAERRHREVLVGVRALSLDLGGAGRFHQGGVPSDRGLEADEAPAVPTRRGELERLVEEARVVEALAGYVNGVAGRRERHELEAFAAAPPPAMAGPGARARSHRPPSAPRPRPRQ